MSLELKKSDVLNTFQVFSLGYCEAQHILNRKGKGGYTAGIYGWNSDIFVFGNIAISTGYRPFSNVTKKQDEKGREIILKYDKKAEKASKNFDVKKYNYDYSKLYKKLESLYIKMFDELKQILINE